MRACTLSILSFLAKAGDRAGRVAVADPAPRTPLSSQNEFGRRNLPDIREPILGGWGCNFQAGMAMGEWGTDLLGVSPIYECSLMALSKNRFLYVKVGFPLPIFPTIPINL